MNRQALQEERLVLISACDPKSGFNVGNAMQRNKYIYALSDAALVVNSDFKKKAEHGLVLLNSWKNSNVFLSIFGRLDKNQRV